MQLAGLDRPELKDEPWVPVTHPRFAAGPSVIFSEIAKADVLVHHPYDSFATSFEAFVRTAASDPDVIGMKATVYRTSDETPLVPAMIEAAENGKQSVCLVELKARFDERRNIEWSQALERAGVHVVHGFPNLKIHAKATLVVRREGGGLRRYVHIGTGNYHSATARIYEDFGLFTADPEIAEDVANLFNYVTGFGRPERFRKLLVAPFNLRERVIEEIRAVAQAAAAKKHARIRLKVNNLSDRAIIDELYLASQAGAKIDLIVRSICAVRPGIKGLSENIRVRSVLGRFLEHSRVYHFEARGNRSYYVGSADLLPRNLDHRLEAVAPVQDARLQQRLGVCARHAARRRVRLDPPVRRGVEAAGAEEGRAAEDRPGAADALGPASPPLAAEGLLIVHRIFTGASPLDRRGARDNGRGVNVAVIDVGSNTIRLLVASRSPRGLTQVARAKRAVGLGADIERDGAISAAKMAEAAECLSRFMSEARRAGAVLFDVVVASPGRQAENGDQLVHSLSRAAGTLVRVLSRDEEARLAFEGALARAKPAGAVAVCDVGGGSTQTAVGTAAGGPAWLRSVDLGSLRLSRRIPCSDPPRKDEIDALRAEARSVLGQLTPPLPAEAIAVGGTARGARRMVGRTLGPNELKSALRLLRREPARAVAAHYDVDVWRAKALPAGLAILAELQALLGVPFQVGRGGLREGLALELLDRLEYGQVARVAE